MNGPIGDVVAGDEVAVLGDGHQGRRLTRPQIGVLRQFGTDSGWVRPRALGGRDGSHHSAVLAQLEVRGLVESKVRSPGVRGSRLYRLTPAGAAVVDTYLVDVSGAGSVAPTDETPCVDEDLERAVDSIGTGRLLFSIADAIAKDMKNPAAAARAYLILLGRMEGKTFDEIAQREGVSGQRIRQVVERIRRIVVARPELFDGFSGLEQAVRNHALSGAERARNWKWRNGIE
ncbi:MULTISPECIES: helix-turn-helix domain-containing protein [Mycobacterium avium complex (MAC)]|uniref:MarR family transcriptional regulator n=1 Tax=Mycobacterium avium complex (MAC) TaxID=120793 RepID=UPI00111BD029|nr:MULTISPECIES: MarR family transcriptional regulator [Mycobacterium avium complex (MAC)]UCN12747.1 MarR family transcriptional regulator [Mycobacterium intracellulare subsp. chimaera]